VNWRCASCDWAAKTNRQKCPRCGSALWKPAPKKDLAELSGPLKRVVPKGLLLANPGKQAPTQDSKSIECGKCHALIYTANEKFDLKAFQEAKKIHYAISPACE
jgi:hypothetical protein